MARGPRRVTMLELRANIQHGLGKTPAAILSLEEALRIAAPGGKASAGLRDKIAAMKKHIEALQSTLVPEPRHDGPGRTTPGKRRPPRIADRGGMQ
jgi:hypothetical protein